MARDRSIPRWVTALVVAMTGFAAASAVVFAQGPPVRIEVHSIETVTLTEQQFLTGAKYGTPATIAGILRVRSGTDRRPAVVLVHGSGGVGTNVERWAQELNGIGVAAFILERITSTAADQEQLAHVAMIVDAYRAVALLARHPRVDPARIAIMGFSKGGFVALYASLKRFQR